MICISLFGYYSLKDSAVNCIGLLALNGMKKDIGSILITPMSLSNT